MRYETSDPYAAAWTDRAYALVNERTMTAVVHDREGMLTDRVSGPCPRCDDHIEVDRPRTAVIDNPGLFLGDRDTTLAPTSTWMTVQVRCGCGRTHQGAPPGITGCGIGFAVPARREQL